MWVIISGLSACDILFCFASVDNARICFGDIYDKVCLEFQVCITGGNSNDSH